MQRFPNREKLLYQIVPDIDAYLMQFIFILLTVHS